MLYFANKIYFANSIGNDTLKKDQVQVFMTILYFFISFISSIAGAISGIGGGIIIKPVLDAATNQSVSAISFLSGCTVLAMSSVSLLRNRKNSVSLDIKCSTVLAAGGIIGGISGKYIFEIIKGYLDSDAILGMIQAGVLLVITLGVLGYMRYKNKLHPKYIHSNTIRLMTGIGLGIISAFLGIGGGPMNIAVLYYFFSMDAKTASINSLYIIFFSQIASLLTTAIQRNIPVVKPEILILMITGGVCGALIGTAILSKCKMHHAERFFTVLLAVISFLNVFNIIRFSLII